jgi:putative endonuclease
VNIVGTGKERQFLGRQGEEEATAYLVKQGYKIIQRNFRCPWGEIDIIAQKGPVLVFIEVRSYKTNNFGLPQESIKRAKQKKVRQVASFYLKKAGQLEMPVRLDVLALKFNQKNEVTQLTHLKNAF